MMQPWPKCLPKFLVLAAVMPLAIAYYSQFFQGAEPCILCLYQRAPFAIVIILGIIGILKPELAPKTAIVAGCIFLVGAGIASYHVGVEQHWWASAASCGGGLPDQVSVADFQKLLTVKSAKACDEIDWALFGISMATYNVAYSSALAVISFVGAAHFRRA